MSLYWDDAYEIAQALIQTHPDQDPLEVGTAGLHRLVTDLADFADDPSVATEAQLEAIQMAWYEEVKG